ncbi:Membrane protein involved in the export of O-antigen and teichoic acid [Terribacillus saccharophilus]|uniref:Membrane protein involved in the export of O-antigen and teichoic acid n=1 Tax=Terribacillus saccharophilus TaxID=361277 RepID=A0AAX2EFE7_9BACI|nr:Membrane protein involved in the export of O-antigen and teichoic acid [Terribacillus saccharophilus]
MKIKKALKGNFLKSIVTLTSGSIVAQLITLLAAPILTRFYSPKELGVYALVLTAESLFASVICGRYDVSIVSEADEEKIYPIVKVCFFITILFSMLASAGYGIYLFNRENPYDDSISIVFFIFVMLFLSGFIKIAESYNNRYKEYKVMTSVYVLRTSIQNVGSIILGFLKSGVLGLLMPHALGLIFGLKRQTKTLANNKEKIVNSSINQMYNVIKLHYRQPLYSAPAVFANRFSYSSIGLFVESMYGLTVLGFYWISYKALGLPLTVMSNNIAKVFYQQASREFDSTGRFKKSFNKTSLFLLIIAIPMVLALYFLAPPAFKIVFGDGWEQAGVYVKILAPMFGIRLIVNTVSYGLQVARKQSIELVLQLLFVVASILCFLIAKSYGFNIENYLKSITISFSIGYIIYYFYVMRCAYIKR